MVRGPKCSNIRQLAKSIRTIPEEHREDFRDSSTQVLKCLTSFKYLHVYHVLGRYDELLLLQMVISRIKMESRSGKGWRPPGAMLVVVEVNHNDAWEGSMDPEEDVLTVVTEATKIRKPRSYEEGVYRFDNVVVVTNRTGLVPDVDNGQSHDEWRRSYERDMIRVIAVIRELCEISKLQKIVWHETTHWLQMLGYALWRANAYRELKFKAVTVGENLHNDPEFTDDLLRPINVDNIQSIIDQAQHGSVPLVFHDHSVLGIEFSAFTEYLLPGLAEYWPVFLPRQAYLERIKTGFDHVASSILQIRSYCSKLYGREAADRYRDLFAYETAQHWANETFRERTYSKEVCKGMLSISDLDMLLAVCDRPLLVPDRYNFQEVAVMPGANTEYLLAASCSIKFDARTISLDTNSSTFILLATDRKKAEQTMLRYWSGYIKQVMERYDMPAEIPRNVAQGWKDLVVQMTAQLKIVRQHRKFTSLHQAQRERIAKVQDLLHKGAFTTICKRSLPDRKSSRSSRHSTFK
jgi:hypothetical protein